jgi:HSP20 family protein
MFRRWDPFEEMNALVRDMDRLFRRTFSETGHAPSLGAGTSQELLPVWTGGTTMNAFTPSMEAYQKDNKFVVRAELPGIDPKDVEVSVVGNQLRLSGERKQGEEIKRDDYYLSECSYGRFERAFTLPEGIKPEDVKASYKNGVLEITLPAKGLAQAHRIQIEGAPEAKKIEAKAAK